MASPEFPIECQVSPVCELTSISALVRATCAASYSRVSSLGVHLVSKIFPLSFFNLSIFTFSSVSHSVCISHQSCCTPGVIKTALPNMDREVKEQYQVLIQAKDMGGQLGGLAGTTTVNITLSDVNDNPPRFSKSECCL